MSLYIVLVYLYFFFQRYIHLCTHAIFSLTSTTSQVMQVIETLVLLISHPASTSVDYNKNLYFKLYSALVVLLWNCDHSSDAVSLATCISMLKRHKLSAIEIGELVSNTLDETKIQLEDKHISRVHHCYQEFVRINDNTKSTNKPVLGHKSKSPQQPDEENSQEDLELPVKKKSRIDLRVMREWTEECSMQAQWIDCMVYVDVFQNKNNTKILRWKLSEKPGSKRRVLSNKQSSNCLHEDEIQIIKSEPVTLFCTINLSKTFYNTFPDSAKNMQPNLNAAIILERNYTVIFDSENNNQYTIGMYFSIFLILYMTCFLNVNFLMFLNIYYMYIYCLVPQPKKAHIFPFSDSAPIPQRYPASEHILCRKTTSLSTKLLVKN